MLTYGIGIISSAIHANNVLAHLYVRVRNIVCVKRGKIAPIIFPVKIQLDEVESEGETAYSKDSGPPKLMMHRVHS